MTMWVLDYVLCVIQKQRILANISRSVSSLWSSLLPCKSPSLFSSTFESPSSVALVYLYLLYRKDGKLLAVPLA